MNLETGDRVIIKGNPDEVFEVLERYYQQPDVQEGLLYVSLKQQNGHEIVQFPVSLLERAPHGIIPGQVYTRSGRASGRAAGLQAAGLQGGDLNHAPNDRGRGESVVYDACR